MMLACIHMWFFQIQVLRKKVLEFSQAFSCHDGLGMVEIYDLLDVGEAASEVDDVVLVGVVFA